MSTQTPAAVPAGWRLVPGWPCTISNRGKIRGPSGKVLKPYVVDGYQHVLIRGRKLRVHHAVLFAFVGPRPPGKECRHLDDNPANNNPENLAWGTRKQNMDDQLHNGRRLSGESKPGAQLTSVQVYSIRDDPRSARTVGAEYGVSHTAILRIRRGERWAAT